MQAKPAFSGQGVVQDGILLSHANMLSVAIGPPQAMQAWGYVPMGYQAALTAAWIFSRAVVKNS